MDYHLGLTIIFDVYYNFENNSIVSTETVNDLLRRKKNEKVPDNMILGLVLGLVFPLLGILIFYFLWGGGNDFGTYISGFWNTKSISAMRQSSKIMSISMFAMLIPFNYFLNKRKYISTRGIIFATAFYAIMIILYNFVWQ